MIFAAKTLLLGASLCALGSGAAVRRESAGAKAYDYVRVNALSSSARAGMCGNKL
jgi:hypothetical protein